jgi:REP element-mobilizing transposase RayT
VCEITCGDAGTFLALPAAMARLRRDVRPHKVYFVSRRCTRRFFLLTPDKLGILARVFWYFLGHAALLTGVQVCAVCVMSSHFHLVIVDRYGRLSEFLHALDRNLALAVKAFRKWPEEIFNKAQCSAVELVSTAAIIEKIAYTVGNGAKSFAVRYSRDWPGALTRVEDLGARTIRAEHTEYWSRTPGRRDTETGAFVDPTERWNATEDDPPKVKGGWPHSVEYDIGLPDVLLAQLEADEARRRIARDVKTLERKAWKEAERLGISFQGPRRALCQKHTRRANSYETFGSRNPRFAAGGDREAAAAAIERNRVFDRDYEEALRLWRSGDRRRAVFPYGTWKMRVLHNARCRPPP